MREETKKLRKRRRYESRRCTTMEGGRDSVDSTQPGKSEAKTKLKRVDGGREFADHQNQADPNGSPRIGAQFLGGREGHRLLNPEFSSDVAMAAGNSCSAMGRPVSLDNDIFSTKRRTKIEVHSPTGSCTSPVNKY